MNSHVRNLILLTFLLIGNISSAITTRGGLITTDIAAGGICSITTQLLIDEIPIWYDTAFIDWGDGYVEPVPLAGWPVSPSNGSYLITLSAIWHSYPSGTYDILLTCGKRVSWIRNILNSGASDFVLQAMIVMNPLMWNSESSLSDSFNLETEMFISSPNTIPLNIYNADSDSVVWSMSFPVGASGYSIPDQVGGGVFNLTQSQSQYEWNPVTPGLYSVAFTFTDYKELSPGNWFVASSVTREVLIDAGQVSSVETDLSSINLCVYPNPSKLQTIFQFSGEPISREVIITDNVGREVWRRKTSEPIVEFPASQFAADVYFYSVEEEREISATGKLIIE